MQCFTELFPIGYGFSQDDLKDDKKAILLYHRLVEAMKFGYAKYSKLGDPDFMEEEVVNKVVVVWSVDRTFLTKFSSIFAISSTASIYYGTH